VDVDEAMLRFYEIIYKRQEISSMLQSENTKDYLAHRSTESVHRSTSFLIGDDMEQKAAGIVLWDMLWSCFGTTICICKGILVFAVLPSDPKVNGTKSKFQLWLLFSLLLQAYLKYHLRPQFGILQYCNSLRFAATDEYCTALSMLLYPFS